MFQFTLIFFKCLGWIKSVFTYLISNPKVLAIIVAVCVSIYGYFYITGTISDLEKKVETETAAKVFQTAEKEKALKIAETNQETINRMEKEEKLAELSSKNLKDQIAKDSKTLAELRNRLNSYSKTDDGAVSRVLADTIETIQESRKGR